jgi:hypothetical protein
MNMAAKKKSTDPVPPDLSHPKADFVNEFQLKYGIDATAASSMYELMLWCNYTEQDAAGVVVTEYRASLERGDLYHQSWLEAANRIMRREHPGLFQGRNQRSPGDVTADQSGLPIVPTTRERRR